MLRVTERRISRYFSMIRRVTNYYLKLRADKKERIIQGYVAEIVTELFKVEKLMRKLQQTLLNKEPKNEGTN